MTPWTGPSEQRESVRQEDRDTDARRTHQPLTPSTRQKATSEASSVTSGRHPAQYQPLQQEDREAREAHQHLESGEHPTRGTHKRQQDQRSTHHSPDDTNSSQSEQQAQAAEEERRGHPVPVQQQTQPTPAHSQPLQRTLRHAQRVAHPAEAHHPERSDRHAQLTPGHKEGDEQPRQHPVHQALQLQEGG